MGTYKEIKGRKVQSFASDPPAATAGQVWFNSTGSNFKYQIGTAAWSSITTCPITPNDGLSAGTPSSYIYTGGSPANTVTQEWNATAWATGGALSITTYNGGSCGLTGTAALRMGGYSPGPAHNKTCDEYNGTSWTSKNDMPGTVEGNAGVGTSTSAMSIGGVAPGGLAQTNSQQWTGTCWNAGPDTNFNIYSAGVLGDSSTSAYTAGGQAGQAPPSAGGSTTGAAMQNFNGTAWSTIGALLLVGRANSCYIGGSSAGIITNGNTSDPAVANATQESESWNGTSWTAIASTTVAALNRPNGSTNASSTSHLITHGINPAGSNGGGQVYTNIKTITQS
jgi:hypothetical protein